jgi:sugar O-acyltransferase (sialic acid O-acetyltransferase NeuD family)
MPTRILVIGAGGHGEVVADAIATAELAGAELHLAGFLDDDPSRQALAVFGARVLGPRSEISRVPHDAIVVAIGHNALRQRVVRQLEDAGEVFAVVRHPGAIVAENVSIGRGTVICAGSVVNIGTKIGEHAILNTACSVDHHNTVGDFAHVAPGAHTGGNVVLGEGAMIGIGATVVPGAVVGRWATVGAGAVVIRPVAPGSTVVGVPACPLRRV